MTDENCPQVQSSARLRVYYQSDGFMCSQLFILNKDLRHLSSKCFLRREKSHCGVRWNYYGILKKSHIEITFIERRGE